MIELPKDPGGHLAKVGAGPVQRRDQVIEAAYVAELSQRLGSIQSLGKLPIALQQLCERCAIAHGAEPADLRIDVARLLVLLVFVLVKGRYVMGARRWIGVGPINFQPSELAKIAVALALASYLHLDAEKRKDGYGLLSLVVPMLIILVPAVLVLKQPDLGTALIICAVGFTQIIFAKVRWKTLRRRSAFWAASKPKWMR